MSQVINLRTKRKQLERDAKRRAGDENAARFGQSKAERTLNAARHEKAQRDLDGHRREDTE